MFHRRLVQLARGVLGPIGVCALAGFVLSAVYLAQALLIAATLTAGVRGDTRHALVLLGAVVAVLGLRALLLWGREMISAWAGGVIRARIRDLLIGALAELGPSWVSGNRVGATRGTVLDGVDGLDPYYSRYLPQIVVTAVVPAVLVGWLFTVEPAAATVVAVAVAVVLVVPRFKDAALLRTGRDRWNTYLDISADYLEAMQGMATLRSFGAATRRRDALQVRSDRLYSETMAELRISLVENGFSALVVQAGAVGAIVAAVLATGERPPAEIAATLFVVLLVANECFRPVRDLNRAWHAGYLGLTAVDGIDAILSAHPPVRDTGTETSPYRGGNPCDVVVDAVTHRYPGADAPALSDVSFVVPAGSTTVVVGRSGAGKSTLVTLLSRQWDPDAGQIRLGSQPLPALGLGELRRTVATVTQHPYLFTGSVADNVRLGAPGADDADIVAAAVTADADGFVRALPDGYATRIDEGGRSLSGGQRQRIALARALIRDPAVLILDEATSHVDVAGERTIVDALRRGGDRRTSIVVAHRLSVADAADQVVVLDHGRVVQCGPPAELAARPGAFSDLLADQQMPA